MWLTRLLVAMGRFVPWSLRFSHRWIFQALLTVWMGPRTFRFTGKCSSGRLVRLGTQEIFVFRMWPLVMARATAWMELVRLSTRTSERAALLLEIAMLANTAIKAYENVCSKWVSDRHAWMKLSARMDRCAGLIQELGFKCALRSSRFRTGLSWQERTSSMMISLANQGMLSRSITIGTACLHLKPFHQLFLPMLLVRHATIIHFRIL